MKFKLRLGMAPTTLVAAKTLMTDPISYRAFKPTTSPAYKHVLFINEIPKVARGMIDNKELRRLAKASGQAALAS